MINVVDRLQLRVPLFWWFQAAGWCCFCILSILVVSPYIRRPWELGYQGPEGLLTDQGVMCLGGLLASLVLRPVCRSLVQRSLSWMAMEVRAVGWSLATGTSAALVVSRFIVAKPEPIELLEACAKASVLLFLWCNLYFSIKQAQQLAREREHLQPVESNVVDQKNMEYASRFTVRTGSRLQVVSVEDLEWIAAAGDYSELHTRSGIHLLRETMNSLEQKLDPARFVRIHRSRIVGLARILELRSIENREYVVKLCDGSQHRSSRTYAERIDDWLRRNH